MKQCCKENLEANKNIKYNAITKILNTINGLQERQELGLVSKCERLGGTHTHFTKKSNVKDQIEIIIQYSIGLKNS